MSASETTCGAVTYIIRIGLCEQWLFFFSPHSWSDNAAQLENHKQVPMLNFTAPLPVMWLIQKSPVWRLFLEIHAGDCTWAAIKLPPGVWHLSSSGEPIVRCQVWILIRLYQCQSQSPKRTTAKPCTRILRSFACTNLQGVCENMHQFCVQCLNSSITSSVHLILDWEETPSIISPVSKCCGQIDGRCNGGKWGCEGKTRVKDFALRGPGSFK